jgi:hypothetical protein
MLQYHAIQNVALIWSDPSFPHCVPQEQESITNVGLQNYSIIGVFFPTFSSKQQASILTCIFALPSKKILVLFQYRLIFYVNNFQPINSEYEEAREPNLSR